MAQHATAVAAPPPAVLAPTPTVPEALAVGAHQTPAPEAPLAPPAAPVAASVHAQALMAPSHIYTPPTLAPDPLPALLPAEIHAPKQVEMRKAMAPNCVSRIPPPRCSFWIAEQAAPTEL